MGVLPGAGATLASAVAYMTEKKLAGAKGEFGKGDMRGLAAPGDRHRRLRLRRHGADADPRRARLGYHLR
ncbi:tripartite tricarboxylate transporter TctA [Pseudomonas aeruginosa]|nr:tripartite tricarboxylate transporter TctA [Pseudomonas aeruginosa]